MSEDATPTQSPVDISEDAPVGSQKPKHGPDSDDPYKMETPFDCFKRPDVLDQLASHPVTRPYSLDSGFRKQIEMLQTLDSEKEHLHFDNW